jgi:tetratricopeptide (TPR) repeat protein
VRADFISKLAICAGLVAITWAVFGQTLGYDFVNYDDGKYVYENADVSRGVTISGVKWAFTHFDKDNWHPLTSISHMMDCQMFDLKPGGHHFTNVLLHTTAAVLLFLVLGELTGGPSRTGTLWASGFVAALFAIHPLHVESVAWIAERKDVLSAVFFMLTLGAYGWYAQRPTAGRYITMSILFACGLMSKAMLVTVPLVLLLLDYWPLNRFEKSGATKLLLEKLPLLALSAGSSIATLLAQQNWEIRLEELPLTWRLENASLACVVYVRQMIWPAKLAVIYPHEDMLPLWQIAGAVAVLIAITAGVFVLRKKSPCLVTGWCWYLIMLVPVLGLIKVGGLAHADRYTYLPEVGLYIAVTFGVVDLVERWQAGRRIAIVVAAALVVILSSRAWSQAGYWRDGETLWRHAIATTTDNDLAHFALADFLTKHQRIGEAIAEYQAGLRIDSKNADAETSMANLLLQAQRGEEAVVHYQNAVRIEPNSALAHYNFAVGLHRLGRLREAIAHYKEALRIQPDYPDADYFLRQALLENGQTDDAQSHLEKR